VKSIALVVTTAIGLTTGGCSTQEPPRRDGVVIVAGKTPAAVPSPAPVEATATTLPAAVAAPTVVEAAVPAPAELADLAVERDVGVLVAAEKARDPFHTAAVDFSAVDGSPTTG
jgi:hypothetical protein